MKQVDGDFWLPTVDESSQARVPGRLSIAEDGEATLELHGSFTGPAELGDETETVTGTVTHVTPGSLARHSHRGRIVGQSGGGVAYTLEDCFVIGRSGLLSSAMRETYTVGRVFQGALFGPDEDLEFHALHLKIDGLSEWLNLSGVTQQIHFEPDQDVPKKLVGATLSMERQPAIDLRHPEYQSAALEHVWSISGGIGKTPSFKEDVVFCLESGTLRSAADFLEVGGDLRSLVSVGGDINAGFAEVKFYRDDLRHGEDEDGPRVPIEMTANWTFEIDRDRGPMINVPFKYADLGGEPVLSGFLTRTASHRSSLVRVMHTHRARGMLVSDRLLNCAAALEAYDRASTKKSDFRDRVIRIVDGVGSPFIRLVGDGDGWSTALKNARNHVAHHNPQMLSSGREQLFLAESAKVLLVMALLDDAGASTEALTRMLDSARLERIKRGLEEVYAAGYPEHPES